MFPTAIRKPSVPAVSSPMSPASGGAGLAGIARPVARPKSVTAPAGGPHAPAKKPQMGKWMGRE